MSSLGQVGIDTITDTQPLGASVDIITPELIRLISATIYDLSGDDGWAFLGDVGTLLQKKQPNFDPRNYGFNKLTPLLASTGVFDITERE